MLTLRMVSVAVAMLLLGACSWKEGHKAMFASYAGFSALDARQTSQIPEYGLREANPIFAEEDGSPNMKRVIGLKAIGAGLLFYLFDKDEEGRETLLAAANLIQGGVVLWNGYLMGKTQEASVMRPAVDAKPGATVYYCPMASVTGINSDPLALAMCESAYLNGSFLTGK